MPIMDVFAGDAFTAVSLTAAVDKLGYVPGYLTGLPGLVVPEPIRTTEVWIEIRANEPALIQTTPRGAPPAQKGGDKRNARAFNTVRLALASRVTASELQNIRAFGSEQALKDLQGEVARRQFKIKQDFALTKENMLLGAVQGIVVDADNSVINDWGVAFSQTIPAEIPFDFTNMEIGDILTLTNQVRRSGARALKGLGGNAVMWHAICGDAFWDKFITTAEVRDTYRFAMQAMQLQNAVGGAWESFRYGQIMWHNYRGTDDNSTVAVDTNKVKFFPAGAGIFQRADAPGEKFEFINTLGQQNYSMIVPDRDRDSWADIEMYSFPLFVCTMPSALGSGRLGP